LCGLAFPKHQPLLALGLILTPPLNGAVAVDDKTEPQIYYCPNLGSPWFVSSTTEDVKQELQAVFEIGQE
jgi:hypothetical protein